jgi:hypothetical protein
MFSNLAQGSILYGLETKDKVKVFTAPITSVSLPRPLFTQNTFGQVPTTVVDIIATVNGEKREFKQVPGNTSIANFGQDAFILADSKESLNSYIESMLQNSRNIVASVDKHKALITQYESAYKELNPSISIGNDDSAVKALESKVDKLETLIKEYFTKDKEENK